MTTPQSRRRRLWELNHNALCPVIGSCFDLSELRKWTVRLLGLPSAVSDFEIHVSAVRACEKRTALAKRLQVALERRFVLEVQRFRDAKSADDVRSLWRDAVARGEIAGALWAAFTHPATDDELSQALYAEIHMLQHQVGAAQRADIRRLHAAQHENGILAGKLAELQERQQAMRAERDRELHELRGELAATRSKTAAFEAAAAASPAELCALRELVKVGCANFVSAERVRVQRLEGERADALARVAQLEAELRELRLDMRRAELELERALANRSALPAAVDDAEVAALEGRAVACVGGRSGLTDRYRQLVECQGGRWLHHDGGEEDSLARLEPVISAADAVICQAGCISHSAYWRVKEFCRRTGKPCVYVKTPSITAFLRGLDAIAHPA